MPQRHARGGIRQNDVGSVREAFRAVRLMQSVAPATQLCFKGHELSSGAEREDVGPAASVVKLEGNPNPSPRRVASAEAARELSDKVSFETERAAHRGTWS